MEDLAQGVGQVNQRRGNTDYSLGQVDTPYAVESEAEMSALDVTKFTRARVYSSVTEFIDYIYDESDTSGIPSNTGPGTWVISSNVTSKTISDLTDLVFGSVADMIAGESPLNSKNTTAITKWIRTAISVPSVIEDFQRINRVSVTAFMIGTDLDSAIQAAIDYAYNEANVQPWSNYANAQPTQTCVEFNLPVIEVSQPITLRSGLYYDFSNTVVKESTSFVGSDLVSSETDIYHAVISGLSYECENLAAYGLRLNGQVRRCSVNGVYGTGALLGIKIGDSGFGCHVDDIRITGYRNAFPGSYSDNPGFENRTSDSKFSRCTVAGFTIPFALYGNSCAWYGCHGWSLPTTVPMKIGFDIPNEGNRLFGCTSDTPTPLDTGQPPSLSNGGYGYLNRQDAIGTEFFGCEVIASEQTGNVDNTVIPFKLDRYAHLYGCRVRNFATSTSIFITPYVQWVSQSQKQLSTVIGGNVLSFSSADFIFAGNVPTPVEIDLAIGGSTTGIAYGGGNSRNFTYSRNGAFITFTINIKLSSKGSESGSVTVQGIPVPMADIFGNVGRAVLAVSSNFNYAGPVFATIEQSSSEIQLFKGNDRTPLTGADITNSQEIMITGSYPYYDGWNEDVD